jgi:glycogen synthase
LNKPASPLPPVVGRLRGQQGVALILQAADHVLDAERFHLALQHFARIADRPVAKLRHVNRPA